MRLLKHFKSIKRRYLVAIVIVILLGVGYTIFSPKKQIENVQFAKVERKDIQTVIAGSGILTGKRTADLKFKSSGRLAYLSVKAGDSVNANQSIAGLDMRDLNIALQQAQNTLRDKQAQVDKALDDVKDHASDETLAQKQTRTTAQVARDNAYDNVRAAQRAFDDVAIYSPITGTVTKADPLPGQIVSSSDLIAQIVDWSEVYFDTDIDEADISKLSVNQKAEVTLNAYPDKVFNGTVSEITPSIKTTSTGSTVIKVRISLGNPSIQLISGLNGQASIVTNEVRGALSIPLEALKDDGTVVVQTDSEFRSIKVKTGISSDNDIEILEGLGDGQQVVKNPTAVKVGNQNGANRFLRQLLPRGR